MKKNNFVLCLLFTLFGCGVKKQPSPILEDTISRMDEALAIRATKTPTPTIPKEFSKATPPTPTKTPQ